MLYNLKDTLSYFNSFLFFYLGRYCLILNEYRTKKHIFNFERESQEKSITIRNKDWIVKIDNTIQEKEKAFIFVGLYHLDFKEGLLELLKSRGYTVEEIILN